MNNPQEAEESYFQIETREIHDAEDQIVHESSGEDVNKDITASELEKAIQNDHPRNSKPALARVNYSDPVPLEYFRNELVTEQQPLIQDTLYQMPNKNPEMSQRNRDPDRPMSQLIQGSEKDPFMEESYQVFKN